MHARGLAPRAAALERRSTLGLEPGDVAATRSRRTWRSPTMRSQGRAILPAMGDATERFLAFVRDRDQQALEDLLRDHAGPAFAQARRQLTSGADAEDAVQEAFIRLVRTAGDYDGRVPFGAWLALLVHDACSSIRRSTRRRRRREASAAPRAEAAPAADDSLAELLRVAVAELPEQFRAPLDLHFFAGLSQEEAASALGLTVSALAVRIHRGKHRLRERLRRDGIVIGTAALALALAAPADAAEPGFDAAVAHRAIDAASRTTIAAGAGAGLWTALASAALVLALGAGLALVRGGDRDATPGSTAAMRTASPLPSPTTGLPLATSGLVASPALGATASPRPLPLAGADDVDANVGRVWDFEHGAPTEFRVLAGSWHHRPDGGVGGSGCMEITSNEFLAAIDLTPPSSPLLLTSEQQPLLPHTPRGYSIFIHWDTYRSFTAVENAGRMHLVAWPFDGTSEYIFAQSFLTDRHLDGHAMGKRATLYFGERAPGARLMLCGIGLQRIDNLRLAPIDAQAVPDVAEFAAALERVERLPNTSVPLPLPAVDPERPLLAITPYELVPGWSPWIHGGPDVPAPVSTDPP